MKKNSKQWTTKTIVTQLSNNGHTIAIKTTEWQSMTTEWQCMTILTMNVEQ